MKLLSTLFFVFTLTALQAQDTLQIVKKSFNDGLPEIAHFYLSSEAEANLIQIKHYNHDGQIIYSADYQKGMQHGKTMYFNDYDLKITKDLNYVNGQLDGIQIGYYNENEKKFEFNYKSGKLHGVQREWKSNGHQDTEWKLENGVLNGIQQFWNNDERTETWIDGQTTKDELDKDKKLVKRVVYQSEVSDENFKIGYSQKVIEETFFYKNGKIQFNYKFGELIQFVSYFENGNKEKEGEFQNRLKTGNWSVWYENSNIKEKGNYEKNEKGGQWETWYSSGQKATEGGYLNNKKDGNWTFWKENGQQEKFGAYKNDYEDGVWQYFNELGKIVEERTFMYQREVLLKVFFYADNGQLIQTGNIDNLGNKAGKWEYWFDDGTKQRIENYKRGKISKGRPLIASFEEWYKNGQLKSKGKDREGTQYTYFDSGAIQSEILVTHHKGLRRFEYYEDGQILKKTTFLRNEGGAMIARPIVQNMPVKETIYFENGNKKSETSFCTNCKTVPAEALKELNNTIGKTCKTCPAYTNAYKNLELPAYNIKHNLYYEWYENGKLHLELMYVNNCLKGMQKEWHSSGEMMLQVLVTNQHPYIKEIIDSENCKMFLTSGTYYNSKGKQLIYKQEYTSKSAQKAAKANDMSLLEPIKKSKKILEIEAQSYFFANFF